MKTVKARDLQKKVRECLDAAQRDRIVVTRHGKPSAVVVGVEGRDWEDVVYQTSAAFWRLIERRRREPLVSMDELRKGVRSDSSSKKR